MMKRQLKDDENETKTKQARPVNSSVDLDTINSEMCKEFDELRKKHEEYSIMIKEKEMIIKEKELMIKEKDMMIKEKDMIIEEIDKLLLWNTLLSSLNSFIFKNLSTIVKSSLGLLGKQWVINSLTLPQFIESTGISLLDPLSESMWRQFCQNVAIVQDEAISERKEVHPVVLQVINNIILSLSDACSWQYSARGEHTDVDDEPIEKMPDISIKLANCKSWAMSDIVIPVKIKSNGNILDAMRQSLGYLAVKLRDQLELSQTRNSKLFGYCVGTDGHKICIGTIIIENYDLRVLSFDLDAIPFWEPDMKCESEGIRLLRSLLSMSPVALGHTFPRRVLTGQHGEETVSFELTGVLGRGGFATAFQAAIVGLPDHSSVVIKAATTTSISLRHNHDDQLHHMSKELNVLRTLNHSATDPNHSSSSYSSTSTAHVRNLNLFPKLIFPEWQCTTKQLFLAMSPVGIPLILYASRLNKYDRSIQVIKLRNQLLEALATANTIGYCHCDLRPDNVIFDSRSELFVIIDWGLGCKPEEAFHKYFGRLPFFHDDIVLSAGSSSPIPYLHKYDVASVHYVAFAFTLGMKQLSVPWIDSMGEKLVNLRKEYVSCDW